MKSSEINQILLQAKEFLTEKQFMLPPWTYWKPADWKKTKPNARK
jgi:D-lyxose ketol-isomerase